MGELPQRLKDQIKGTAQRNQQPAGYGMYTPGGVRCRRVGEYYRFTLRYRLLTQFV